MPRPPTKKSASRPNTPTTTPSTGRARASKGETGTSSTQEETPKRASRSSTSKGAPETPKSAAKNSPKSTPSNNKKSSPKGSAVKASPKTAKPVLVESESEDEDDNTEFKVGDLIDAEWDDGLFYSAKVVKVNTLKSGNTYDVEFIQDKVRANKLKRTQIQSYSEEESQDKQRTKYARKHVPEDTEYVDGGEERLQGDDEIVLESDERKGRKKSRKPRKKRESHSHSQPPSKEKRQKLALALEGLGEKQLLTLLKKSCGANAKVLAIVQANIPEKKAAKPKAAAKPAKPKVPTKAGRPARAPSPKEKSKSKAQTKTVAKALSPKTKGKAGTPTRSSSRARK